jgi:hypothetical protein
MAKQTAVEWLVEELKSKGHALITSEGVFIDVPITLLLKANEMFHNQIKDAVLYGLDEDGHTGDWKISVAENYYIKTYTK